MELVQADLRVRTSKKRSVLRAHDLGGLVNVMGWLFFFFFFIGERNVDLSMKILVLLIKGLGNQLYLKWEPVYKRAPIV